MMQLHDVVSVNDDGTIDVTAGVNPADGSPGRLAGVRCVDGLTPTVGCLVLVAQLDGQPLAISTIGA